MRIAISGSSGLIGSAVVASLEKNGDATTRLKRGVEQNLDGYDAVIHLAGEPIAGLWTPSKKRAIRDSRVQGTTRLATSLQQLANPPRIFISASAIGYYGDRGNEALDDSATRGQGFLADVVQAWEDATLPAKAAGARVVNLRFGIVLSRDGGALGTVLPLFKAGLGGKLGSGKQIWSWVALDDVVGSILFALRSPELEGPVNVVAPLPVTNLAFTRAVGRVLRRPTVLGAPEILLKTLGGEMAREMLLASARVVPRKLQQAGYTFAYPELESALRHVLATG